ncbi:hypothetical protein [Lysobacter gummosus]|uniref:hypothetical protein n=1 Tax=Lysobacter gummosus TaxID=262324 RepID=UPI00363CCABF
MARHSRERGNRETSNALARKALDPRVRGDDGRNPSKVRDVAQRAAITKPRPPRPAPPARAPERPSRWAWD